MVELIARQSALAGLLRADAAGGTNEVRVEEVEDVTQLQLFARKGKADAFAKAVARFLKRKKPLGPLEGGERNGVFVCAVGPQECWALARGRSKAKGLSELEKAIGDDASVFDQSHGRFVVRLSGPGATDVLARGASLDLHDPGMPEAWGSHAPIEHMPALVIRRMLKNTIAYDVSIPRSYAGSFVAWLR